MSGRGKGGKGGPTSRKTPFMFRVSILQATASHFRDSTVTFHELIGYDVNISSQTERACARLLWPHKVQL